MESESPEAYEAFLCYFELGHKRTLKRAAEELGASENTLGEWSSKFQWRRRIREYCSSLAANRVQTQAAATQEQSLAKAERELAQLNFFKVIGSQLLQSAQNLFQHQLLTNPDKIDMNQILKMMQLGQKLMTAAENSDDLLQSVEGAALEQKLREAGEWIYTQKQAAELAAKGCDYTGGEGI